MSEKEVGKTIDNPIKMEVIDIIIKDKDGNIIQKDDIHE